MGSELKINYNLPKPIMTSADFTEIIKDDNIRSVLRAPKLRRTFSDVKLNPLVNEKQLFKLNPYAAVEKTLLVPSKPRVLSRSKRRSSDWLPRLAWITGRWCPPPPTKPPRRRLARPPSCSARRLPLPS